jgi:hypothetical protein
MFPSGVFFDIEGAAEAQRLAVAETFEAIERGPGPHIGETFIVANRRRADLVVRELYARGTFV